MNIDDICDATDGAHRAAVKHAVRTNCVCAANHVRGHYMCEYHQGYEDGYDVGRGLLE